MSRLLSLLISMVLGLSLFACSQSEEAGTATPVTQEPLVVATESTEEIPPVEPTEPAEPTQSVALEADPIDEIMQWNSFEDEVSRLPGYRREMIVQFEPSPGEPGVSSWQIKSNYVVSEKLSSRVLEIHYEGDVADSEFQSMTVGQVNGNSFLHVPGVGCISTSQEQVDRISSGVVDPDYFLAGLVNARLIASDELVNDQPAWHFYFDNGSLPRFAGQDVSVDGNLFVAEQGGHPLRVSIVASGPADYAAIGQTQDGTLHLELNVYDIGDSAELAVPSDCLQPVVYPLPDEIYNITAIEDFVGFRTQMSITELVEFFLKEMATDGWLAVEEPTVLDDMAFMTYSRNDVEIVINIEVGSATGELSVLISP